MCQATVYLGEQEIARDVAWLERALRPCGGPLATCAAE